MTEEPSAFAIVTLVTAIVGAASGLVALGLSAFNTFHAYRKDAVRLKVIPKLYRIQQNGRLVSSVEPEPNSVWHGCALEIINVGFLPATVDEIGWLGNDGKSRVVVIPEPVGGQKLPHRIEPRSALTLYIPSNNPESIITEGWPHVKCIYAATACGLTFHGKSKLAIFMLKKGKRS
jgi:hypothetical protein